MAFDVGAGLSEMGKSVAQTAQAYTLESQKAELEQEKIKLADQLAGVREEKQRGFVTSERLGAEKHATGEKSLDRASELERTKLMTQAQIASAGATAGAHLTAAREHIAAQLQLAGSTPHIGEDGAAFTINPKTGIAKPMTMADGSPVKVADPIKAKQLFEANQGYRKDKAELLSQYKIELAPLATEITKRTAASGFSFDTEAQKEVTALRAQAAALGAQYNEKIAPIDVKIDELTKYLLRNMGKIGGSDEELTKLLYGEPKPSSILNPTKPTPPPGNL